MYYSGFFPNVLICSAIKLLLSVFNLCIGSNKFNPIWNIEFPSFKSMSLTKRNVLLMHLVTYCLLYCRGFHCASIIILHASSTATITAFLFFSSSIFLFIFHARYVLGSMCVCWMGNSKDCEDLIILNLN